MGSCEWSLAPTSARCNPLSRANLKFQGPAGAGQRCDESLCDSNIFRCSAVVRSGSIVRKPDYVGILQVSQRHDQLKVESEHKAQSVGSVSEKATGVE